MIDLDELERLANAAIESTAKDFDWHSGVVVWSDYREVSHPDAVLALITELRTLRAENMLCRAAIEDAVDMVDVCANECEDDMSQGALRATKRQLSEAIGKACPRLLCERPEGQKLYGLRWLELIEENKALRARLEIDPRHSVDGIDARDETIRGLEADAQRYRYLRSAERREALHMAGPAAGCWIDSENERGVLVLLTEEDADAAIDAAIAAHPKEGV